MGLGVGGQVEGVLMVVEVEVSHVVVDNVTGLMLKLQVMAHPLRLCHVVQREAGHGLHTLRQNHQDEDDGG